MAAGLVHPVAAAAGGHQPRPAAARLHARGAGTVRRPPGLPVHRSGPMRASEGSTGSGRPTRLPQWLVPRDEEARGTGQLRLVETTLLVLVALLLAVATV